MHGNDFAFEKVEADIKSQGIDQAVCLGDAIIQSKIILIV
jgi:predicted phosphodiesterase